MNALAALSPRERFYEQARQEFEDIVGYVDSAEAQSMTHSELERELEKKGYELMRKLLPSKSPIRSEMPSRSAVKASITHF